MSGIIRMAKFMSFCRQELLHYFRLSWLENAYLRPLFSADDF